MLRPYDLMGSVAHGDAQLEKKSGFWVLEEGEDAGENFFGGIDIGGKFEIGVLAGMGKAGALFFILGLSPVHAALQRAFVFAMQIDEDIGFANLLPHAGREGMLLRDLFGRVAVLLQAFDEGAFA